jgi:hypothetical protein
MTTTEQVSELRALWIRPIEETYPDEEQFFLWLELHSIETIWYGLANTALNAQNLRGVMDFKISYASSVMPNYVRNPRPLPKVRP